MTAVAMMTQRSSDLVDPNTATLESRDGTERRRTEQIKLIERDNAARIAKIAPRQAATRGRTFRHVNL
jgi:hypothetical protein